MLVKLQFKPGLAADGSRYSGAGQWVDGDKVRFRAGFPEKIGGWQRSAPLASALSGTARALIAWANLRGDSLLGIGTSAKYYIEQGSTYYDISPYTRVVALVDPFTTTAASHVVTVTDAGHGQVVGNIVVVTGATPFDGITPNGTYTIATIIGVNTYTITAAAAATAGAVGGGAATLSYALMPGLDTSTYGTGWGAGGWGGLQPDASTSGWGASPASGSTSTEGARLRLWTHDIFGQDLVLGLRDGAIYYWAASGGLTTPAVLLSSKVGAASVPTVARQVLVTDQDRRVIAFGCTDATSGAQDLLLIRWTDAENPVDWAPTDINSAGDLRIPSGAEFVAARETKQEVLVWSDDSLHSLRYVGAPYIYGITRIGLTNLVGPNAVAGAGDVMFWMGSNAFYRYDGRIASVPCAVRDYVFNDINLQQADKIFGGGNGGFNEVWWFYPSGSSEENDRYVTYNYQEDTWSYGSLERTAWLDRLVEDYPRAAAPDGYIYFHEIGSDDGSTNPVSAIEAWVESGPVEIGSGDDFGFAWRMIPDVGFRNSTGNPTVSMTLKAQDWAGDTFTQTEDGTVMRSATVPVEQFTQTTWFRLRGRALTLRVSSDAVGVAWRLGVPRIDVRQDGKR
jgi:hypothetical protein